MSNEIYYFQVSDSAVFDVIMCTRKTKTEADFQIIQLTKMHDIVVDRKTFSNQTMKNWDLMLNTYRKYWVERTRQQWNTEFINISPPI